MMLAAESQLQSYWGQVWSPISSEDEVKDFDEGSVDEADDCSIQMEHINKIIEGNEEAKRLAVMKWTGFKLVGDNVDKDIKPAFFSGV